MHIVSANMKLSTHKRVEASDQTKCLGWGTLRAAKHQSVHVRQLFMSDSN
jgi:hypothetical protein